MKQDIVKGIFHYALLSTPKRWRRLIYHFYQLLPFVPQAIPRSRWFDWPVDLLFYVLDIVYIPEIYTLGEVLWRNNIRSANELENYLMAEYFNGIIDGRFVLFNDKAAKIVRKYAHALVTFHMIHFETELSEAIIVHELVHVHQYQKFGSVYLYRALQAQMSPYTYDYGGVERLVRGIEKGKKLYEYNFEQQAAIIEDYYRENNQFTLFYSPTKSQILEKYYKDLFV
ncbi:MAG TPA: hypothetical protein PKD85_15720 [Saprospiraceae bacterium]|nr:hypothetical protein [Saprospiraceae bacterium]